MTRCKSQGETQAAPAKDPEIVALETVMLEVPELVRLSYRVRLLPTCTLPKPMLDGFGANEFPPTPIPDSVIVSLGLEALLMR